MIRQILLVRHGETEGESSIRYHGSTDVALSDEGRAHMSAARLRLPGGNLYDLVVSSPLQRAFESAEILAPGVPTVLEADELEEGSPLIAGLKGQLAQTLSAEYSEQLTKAMRDEVGVETNEEALEAVRVQLVGNGNSL